MNKKYSVIYIDPPWKYRAQSSGRDHKHGAQDKYDLMDLDEIKKVPIKELSEDDCVIFMWATTPLLPEAIEVMLEWGFTYKTAFTWIKTAGLGMGHWFRINTEHLLIGVKGDIKPFRSQQRNHYTAPITKHSAKPHYFYSLIETLGIPGEKIELFARHKRQGWDVWGNEIPKDTQMILSH